MSRKNHISQSTLQFQDLDFVLDLLLGYCAIVLLTIQPLDSNSSVTTHCENFSVDLVPGPSDVLEFQPRHQGTDVD